MDVTQMNDLERGEYLFACPLQFMIPADVECNCRAESPASHTPPSEIAEAVRVAVEATQSQEGYAAVLSHISPWAHKLCQTSSGMQSTQLAVEAAIPGDREMFLSQINFDEVIRDPHGSRLIQLLAEQDSDLQHTIFDKIMQNFAVLAQDPCGNYAVQRVCGLISWEKVIELVDRVTDECVNLSMNGHGAYVMQAILNKVADLARLSNKMEENTHKLETARESLKKLLHTLAENGMKLAQDKHGNYTLQAAIDLFDEEDCAHLSKILCVDLVQVAASPRACRVIEHVLVSKHVSSHKLIISQILSMSGDRLDKFLEAKSAWFIIRKAIDCAQPKERRNLVPMLGWVHSSSSS